VFAREKSQSEQEKFRSGNSEQKLQSNKNIEPEGSAAGQRPHLLLGFKALRRYDLRSFDLRRIRFEKVRFEKDTI
jgi:hypothetical protein